MLKNYIKKKEKNILYKFKKVEDINSKIKEIVGKEKLYNMFQILKKNKILNINECKNENKLISKYCKI